MQSRPVTTQDENEFEPLMDFSGMSIGDIEAKMEMAITTANDYLAVAAECRRKLNRLKVE